MNSSIISVSISAPSREFETGDQGGNEIPHKCDHNFSLGPDCWKKCLLSAVATRRCDAMLGIGGKGLDRSSNLSVTASITR